MSPGDVLQIRSIDIGEKDGTAMRSRRVERPPAITLEPFEGTVDYVDYEKQFGFVRPDGSMADVMFHITSCRDYAQRCSETFETLVRGERVRGVARMTGRGPRAERLERVMAGVERTRD
jgi:cold shock CspA family protein